MRRDWAGGRPCDRIASRIDIDMEGGTAAQASGAYGTSAIFSLSGYETAEMIWPEPNTNLMYPRTLLPMLLAHLPAGEHTLVCAVFSDAGDSPVTTVPKEVLELAGSL